MPRARQIKYGFFINDKLAALPPLCRLLFIGLWTIADREGKVEDRPKKIHAQLLPYDNDADIDAYIDALQDAQFLRRYKIGDASFIKILNFGEHQNPHPNEAPSMIPELETQPSVASTLQEPDEHNTNNAFTSFTSFTSCKKEKKKKDTRLKFKQLYEAYPVHKDKERAIKAFKKLNPDEQLLNTMLEAIENQKLEKEAKTTNKEFAAEWKYLATWINQKCWTDEIDLAIIAKVKKKKSPYMICAKCKKEILKVDAVGIYCEKCDRAMHPMPKLEVAAHA